jgi:hypothetical protein
MLVGRNSDPKYTADPRCDAMACARPPWPRMSWLLCAAASMVGSKRNVCGSGDGQVEVAMDSTSGRNHEGGGSGSGGARNSLMGSSRLVATRDLPNKVLAFWNPRLS